MESKMFAVEVRGDDYDYECECWSGECMELLDVTYFDTFEEAKEYCNAFTPMTALKYEKESGYNGLNICIYGGQFAANDYVMLGSYDWIGMYKVGASTKYEFGTNSMGTGFDECGVADSVIEAMAIANEMEVEFCGLPLGPWRLWTNHNGRKMLVTDSNDEFGPTWVIREA